VALSILIISFLVFPSQSLQAQTNYDSEAIGLGTPQVEITPSSGPPGTKVEIRITNIVPVPKSIDPRTELFVFLPFLKEVGSNVPHNCAGEYCIPVYSFEEIGSGKIGPKTITFTIFSKSNPKPIVLAGFVESVCDLKINGKTIERYGNTCYEFNQPAGKYEIKFAWGIQRTDVYDVRKTVVFTVTEGGVQPAQQEKVEQQSKETDNQIIEQFEKGLITEEEFENKLRALGYDSQEIREAKALIGKLEHQIEPETPKQETKQEMEEESSNGGGCLIATATYGTELAPQVQLLREIRDNKLLLTESGSAFMKSFNTFYYSFSPTIADLERQNPVFKEAVKVTITPLLMSLSILNHGDIDSEAGVLGYGIGLILLNVGMYFVAPAYTVIQLKKKLNSKA